MRYFVEIHAAGASAERYELPDGEAALGNGADATVRVESAQLSAPLMIVTVQVEKALVRIPDQLPGSLNFRGEVTREAAVPWGEDLYVGGARLAFVAERSDRKNSQGVLLFAALGVLVAAVVAWPRGESNVATGDALVPPSFAASHPVCAEQLPDAAMSRAKRLLTTALAKEQRAPFDRRDGVEALGLLNEAQACFERAGAAEDAKKAAEQLGSWKAVLDQEYAALRLRLRMALEQNRPADALLVVRALESLLAGQGTSPYRTWLGGLHQDLERRAPGPRK